jgi:CelD/BcsL family acetyltransferase involved in cellulose biosynthesis
VRRRGGLAGVLPLRRLRATVSSPTNVHTPAFAPLAENVEAAGELGRALAARRALQIVFEYVDAEAPVLQACLEPCRARGCRLLTRAMRLSPYVPLDQDVSEFEQTLTSKRRSNLRRVRRRLESRGELSLEVADGTERLDELLAEGFRVEGAAWKEASSTAISSRPETRRFYTAAARWAAENALLRLAFLRLDGAPVAFDYCLEDDGCHYLLKTGYDPQYRSDAPGMLMRYEMIRRAFALGLRSYEFLGDNQRWKLEWTDKCHERSRVRVYAASAPGRLLWRTRSSGGPLARRVLQRLPR